jgi:UDP-N-acetylglucosamine 4,6-dehydratase/5-epimerase
MSEDHFLKYVEGKVVLITGAAGTIGSALADKLVSKVKALRCYDHGESELFFLHQKLSSHGHVAPQLGDIRDLDRLRFAMAGVDIVFHTAALKHVGLGEYNPFEVVQSNLVGLNNVIRAALDTEVERVIFTSSDKAVNPTNVMGASKMMGERLISAANEIRGWRKTKFSSVRFGNVIGSRGSVVPIFAKQLLHKRPLTLTAEDMSRYVMTIDEAANLVIEAGSRMFGGEVFVTKMRALRILDLAKAMSQMITKQEPEVNITGSRPGEKLYEELVTDEEIPRTFDLEHLLVVLPSADSHYAGKPTHESFPDGKPVQRAWHSGNDRHLSVHEIIEYLEQNQILEPFLSPGGW